MTLQQAAALKAIVDVITETVKEVGPQGAPAGPMYAAMMSHGCTLNQFESLMGALVRLGKLRQEGNLYFIA
jgi:hypothetical protein